MFRSHVITFAVLPTIMAPVVCFVIQAPLPDNARPSFEVASVKLAGRSTGTFSFRGGPGSDSPGQITWTPTVLMTVLSRAYGVPPDQISGPNWLNTELYSIVAKIPPNTDEHRFQVMLQRLLSERFHLTLHHAKKEFPVYELIVAKGGPKLKPARPDAADMGASSSHPSFPREFDKNGFPVLPPGAAQLIAVRDGMVRSTFRATMNHFVSQLGMMATLSTGDTGLTPRVVDRTGLVGKFEFRLEFARSPSVPARDSSAEAGSSGPSLFTALQNQLGLKLVKGKKANLDLLVIDYVDKVPTEN